MTNRQGLYIEAGKKIPTEYNKIYVINKNNSVQFYVSLEPLINMYIFSMLCMNVGHFTMWYKYCTVYRYKWYKYWKTCVAFARFVNIIKGTDSRDRFKS
jgi:hypothetical protein